MIQTPKAEKTVLIKCTETHLLCKSGLKNSYSNLKDIFAMLFVATASIDGSHFVIAWVSEDVTPQQEA